MSTWGAVLLYMYYYNAAPHEFQNMGRFLWLRQGAHPGGWVAATNSTCVCEQYEHRRFLSCVMSRQCSHPSLSTLTMRPCHLILKMSGRVWLVPVQPLGEVESERAECLGPSRLRNSRRARRKV